MTLHHATEIAAAGAVGILKLLGSGLAEMLGDALVEGVAELVKAPFRRGRSPRKLTGLERDAEERRIQFWSEVLTEARRRTSEQPDPDPHHLKLPRVPRLPRADWARSPDGPGDGACPPRRRSTGG